MEHKQVPCVWSMSYSQQQAIKKPIEYVWQTCF